MVNSTLKIIQAASRSARAFRKNDERLTLHKRMPHDFQHIVRTSDVLPVDQKGIKDTAGQESPYWAALPIVAPLGVACDKKKKPDHHWDHRQRAEKERCLRRFRA